MAEQTAKQITGSFGEWTAFLETAGRLYKYPFHEQLMIFAQKPNATACADYDLWNKQMRRYVRRGSKGIALIDTSGDNPKLKYVFDVADTGGRENSCRPFLWEYRDEHRDAVAAALENRYGVSGKDGLADQLEQIASQLVTEYWNDNSRDILDILAGSFLEEYDDFNVGVAFRNAATISTTYTLMSRCGLNPGEYFAHEDFLSVFDFNTRDTIAALGSFISNTTEQILRQIEITIKNYEREQSLQKQAERTDDYGKQAELHENRRLPDSEPGTERDRDETPRQVRSDEKEVSAGAETRPLELHDPVGEVVSPSEGDRRDSEQETGAADERADEAQRRDGAAEGERADEVGRSDEQSESTGRRNDPERTDLQLNIDEQPQRGAQITLFDAGMFPSEEEQINLIDEAESVRLFAFSFAQEDIDHVLRLGSNEKHTRSVVVAEFQKQKSVEEIAGVLKSEFYGGAGFKSEHGEFAAWYAEDGIHLAKGRSSRYARSAQVISWEAAAERIGQLIEEGRYATNVEIVEAAGYERTQLAESLWYLRRDLSEEARERGFLSAVREVDGKGFPDETQQLSESLLDPNFSERIRNEYAEFLAALKEDSSLLRFRYHKASDISRRLDDLSLPRREYASDMAEMPSMQMFITEDEIDATLTRGSNIAGSKGRIYTFFTEGHSTKEKVDFLKHDYGLGGSSHAVSRTGWVEYSGKGIKLQKASCPDVELNWNKVAARFDHIIRNGRYFTPEEKAQYDGLRAQEQQLKQNVEPQAEETEGVSPVPLAEPETSPLEPPSRPLTQDDIDDALRAWNGDVASKRAVVRYMKEHERDKGTAAWLAREYGSADSKSLFVGRSGSPEKIELPWAKVQRRIAQLIRAEQFYTPEEYDRMEDIDGIAIRENLAARGLGSEADDSAAHADDPFIRMVESDAERVFAEENLIPGETMFTHNGQTYMIDRVNLDTGTVLFQNVGFSLPAGEEVFQSAPISTVRLYMEQKETTLITEKEPAPESSTTDPSYFVGDTVYLDNTAFEITEIGLFDVQLLDHSLPYPVFRSENKEHLMQMLRQDDRNQGIFDREKSQSDFITETKAVYPAEENHLPYDVVIQTLRTSEPDPPVPTGNTVPTQNFCITNDRLGEGGAKAKFRMNMDAINLLKELEFDGRQATPEEQTILSKYVGWGGLADAFDETKDNWKNEFAELYATLSPEEYAAARSSTLNAHYTSPVIIKAIYDAVEKMGFQTGNILEPAMGVGNFFGCLPESMRNSRLYGVELDSITGRIAQQLYPKAEITVAGFETTDRRDFYDLAIGNVPFGQHQINDRAYNKLGFSIHDYFFAKALDQVRPGGVIAFVTSRYTMDKQSPEVRKYIAQRAELLGAIRLPNNAFKANAGAEVVSDILFLQKRDRPIVVEPDWVHLGENEDGYAINSYFIDHPEMMLGRQSSESTPYGKRDFTLEPIEDLLLEDQLADAVKHIQGTYMEAELPELGEGEEIDTSIPADPNVKNYSYTVVDGDVYYRENSRMVKPDLNATAKERVKGMVELRDCVQKLIAQQMDAYASDEAIRHTQYELNELYDNFTAKYGLINSRGNALAFADDSSYYLLCSLEVLDEESNLKRKADMFTKRTIKPHEVVTSVDTASEALALSISEKARVDLAYMSQLTGKDEETLVGDLAGVIFYDPVEREWQTADEYLSGNVREKLRIAQSYAAPGFPKEGIADYKQNVLALEKAQPKDLDASEIEVRLGATWIDKDYIQQFMQETFETPYYLRRSIEVNFSSFSAEWNITGKSQPSYSDVNAYMTYGTDRANAYKILEETLNLRDIRIYDTVIDPSGGERRVLNSKETTLAQQKQQAIKDAFQDWIWKDPTRRRDLVARYNELFNSTRPREYDGSHITFSGMNPEIQLREHQKNAVAHILYGGNTLLAHEVGAGKTFEMVAAAMESKRLGLCQKPLFVVPNHLTEQWASEFLRLYPSANILAATKKDFEPRNRKKFCGRIATGDYDAIIIGHSQFEKLPVSQERQESLLYDQIAEIEEGISELKASRSERFTIKSLERTKKGLEARLKKLQDSSRKDDVITFEQLGVDRLYVDEAHAYKNLFLYTKMRNVAGLSTSDAQKSSDMLLKCRYIDEMTGSKGVVFATGTPVSNSMTELYTMMRYLQHNTIRDKGLAHFDCWASTFGETTTAIELAPEGTGYRARTRFAKFFNLPELMNLFKEAADIKTADQLNLPTPKPIYHNVVAQPTEIQKAMVQELSNRAAKVHAGSVDASVDNMLKITSDGRKLGLDQRIINPDLPDDPMSKVNMCVDNIHRIWEEGQSDKLTQLVFCDLSTPKAAKKAKGADNLDSPEVHALEMLAEKDGGEEEKSFTVYDDIREKLVARGIPREQIAFIHEANTEARKKELFSKVRSGQVRVLMGSTFKMGAGMNVQDRLVALHDLDAPWRPGDVGRILRTFKIKKNVEVTDNGKIII
ncbi:MAG: DEAD/DEAH box helicase family protein [Oscillospiraceae bacterium]|nr:DEAD/DEAH box helicase family protein [Oscillospiraceae bacterium]